MVLPFLPTVAHLLIFFYPSQLGRFFFYFYYASHVLVLRSVFVFSFIILLFIYLEILISATVDFWTCFLIAQHLAVQHVLSCHAQNSRDQLVTIPTFRKIAKPNLYNKKNIANNLFKNSRPYILGIDHPSITY